MDATTTRLRQILECAATVPGYRDRFQSAGLLTDRKAVPDAVLIADWQQAFLKLQPLDRATVQSQPGAFLATATDVVYRGVTSGTQGQSLIYFAGAAWNQARLHARTRSLARWGITDEVPILTVASRLLPLRPVDGAIAGTLTPQLIHQLLEQLSTRPTVLRGYPSRLCEVAVQLSHTRLPPIVAVICTGECLFEQQRSLLERVFCAPVVNEYGCQETGISGLTCPEAGRLHLDSDRCYYEIVNGQLLTTDLFNQVMPMVRYDCGDRLAIDSEPCSCGRSGLTATVLGRAEDRVDTLWGQLLAGAVSMPALDGIQQYRVVQHEASHLTPSVPLSVQVQAFVQLAQLAQPVQPARPAQSQLNSRPLDHLVDWVKTTFGDVKTQVVVEEIPVLHSSVSTGCDESTWMQTITQGSWAQWLKQPVLPLGSARWVAELWSELINPQIVFNAGLSPKAWRSLQTVLDSPTDVANEVEWIKVRLLLFACSFLPTQTSQETQATQVYQQAIERFHRLLQRQTLSQHQASLLHLDRLIASLYLPNGAAIWVDPIPNLIQLDTFAVNHLLQALEAVAHQAIAHHRLPHLRPLLSVLIGDLQFFAPRFGVWLLAYWFEWLRQPIPWAVPTPTDPFSQAWLTWRQTGLEQMQTEPMKVLEALARSPLEHARVVLERGYGQLLQQQPLDPEEWLPLVRAHSGAMAGSSTSNPMAWAPILKALAISLMAVERRDLAYQCLVAATAPASRVSAFERLAAGVSGKQSILGRARMKDKE
ncbi:MAG: hypothetical protein SFY66_09070 [Oculatellaceae cyanobacterium bins.114]|nr:hypothetical protein [Oculatellaceae cyanobacterium bins.114]